MPFHTKSEKKKNKARRRAVVRKAKSKKKSKSEYTLINQELEKRIRHLDEIDDIIKDLESRKSNIRSIIITYQSHDYADLGGGCQYRGCGNIIELCGLSTMTKNYWYSNFEET